MGLIFKRHWDFLCLTEVVYAVCCRRCQVDTWISMWAYISKALGFSLFDGRCIRRVLKTISVRYSNIDVGLIYIKGTGIFLLTAEDDFSSILGYRCGPYI